MVPVCGATAPTVANRKQVIDTSGTLGWTPRGVTNYSGDPGHGVLMAVNAFNWQMTTRLTVNGSGTGATISAPTNISTLYDAANGPVNPAQPGGTTGNISIYGAIGTTSGTGVIVGNPFLLQQGAVANFTGPAFDTGASKRWGDYSATVVDPADANLFWTFQEIPSSATTWTTRVVAVAVPEPSAYAMALAGLAVGGVSMSRRRSAPARHPPTAKTRPPDACRNAVGRPILRGTCGRQLHRPRGS